MERYDYSKLLGRMRERGMTQREFAKEVGISEATANMSLNNKRDFRQDEITRAISILGIDVAEIPSYFFTHQL